MASLEHRLEGNPEGTLGRNFLCFSIFYGFIFMHFFMFYGFIKVNYKGYT